MSLESFSKHNATSKRKWKWRGNIHVWEYDAIFTPFSRRLWRRVVFAKTPYLQARTSALKIIFPRFFSWSFYDKLKFFTQSDKIYLAKKVLFNIQIYGWTDSPNHV